MCLWLKILQNARMRENADPPFSHQKTEVAENKFFTKIHVKSKLLDRF